MKEELKTTEVSETESNNAITSSENIFIKDSEVMYEELLNSIAQYNRGLADSVLQALNERFASALTHGLNVAEIETEKLITGRVIAHMLESHNSRYEIYEYLKVILRIPDEIINELYDEVQKEFIHLNES